MADYKFKNIPDPERCSVGQALMWWKSRQQPVSLLIEQKLNRSERWYLSKWNLSDVDAFFELCAGRVAFWAKPAQNITSIALRDETANVDIDLRLTGYQVNHGSNVAVHVAFDGLGEFEKIPPNRLNKAMLFPGGLVNTVPVWHPDMIKEYPSELWAYFFVEVDFKELVALFPPTETAVIDPPKHPVSDSGATNAGTSNAQAEQLQWLESNADRQLPKKAIHPLFATKFPTATFRDWNYVFGKWAGTAGKAHRPRKSG
jgi:hypothetical protein